MTGLRRASLLAGLVMAVGVWAVGPSWAGGATLDDDDPEQANAGVSFFGFAKDLDRGGGVPDAKVSAQIKNHNASLVTRTDDQGHFKFSGFAEDIDPKDVEITCTKEGFTMQRTQRRRPSGGDGAAAAVEVDCLMVRQ